MKPKTVSIISTFTNLGLGLAKLFFGFLINSVALMADGVHSSMDVFSSFVAFYGIKVAEKPVDEEHPYGHWRAESLAGFIVTIILAISGLWILYESAKRFFGEKLLPLSFWAILVLAVSIILTEVLARMKFHYGQKYKSVALVADAQHSRADVLSSIGVLIGVLASHYFSLADAVTGAIVGLYILYEAFEMGKEITDSLLDVANKDVEERIRKICKAHNVEIDSLKTRKIGAFNFAEIKIKLQPNLTVKEVQNITSALEERFLANIPELKQIVISIQAYDLAKQVICTRLGKRIGELEGFEKVGPKKRGQRIIIPLEKDADKISSLFGGKRYLVLDKTKGRILMKKIVENPYFSEESPHGIRFAKAIRADKIFTRQIGDNAKQNLKNYGIEAEVIEKEENLNDLLEKIEKGDEQKNN
ncbi:cation diffusion facilitator family transporter [bacterium]|nr:cation diffusion facilitator family transporter [bacterium]